MIPFEAIALPLYQVVDKMKMVNTYQGMVLPSIASGLVLVLFVQFFKDTPGDLYGSMEFLFVSIPPIAKILCAGYYQQRCERVMRSPIQD